jgi:hypothetical protein
MMALKAVAAFIALCVARDSVLAAEYDVAHESMIILAFSYDE